MRKLWGGAFSAESEALVDRFGQSIDSDLRFWREDVLGSVAHARMLGSTGILEQEDAGKLIAGLERILGEGSEKLPRDVEDVHTAVEVRLGEIVGSELAGRLHTARSRNDQVATDARLYLRSRIRGSCGRIKHLQGVLIESAARHKATIMPGYTHQQPAQPITLGLHQLAHFWAFQRNGRRFEFLEEVSNLSPLGAAALAGTGFPIDRVQTSEELGFRAPIPNALDATSDRSFVLDALHVCASILIDLSRMAQEFVMWSGSEFGFVRLSDGVTTGSSIMPQKRNPDMAELIRGRTGRAIGNWTAFAATLKGLPLGYNRDTQDDKPGLFESFDLVDDGLDLMALMVGEAEWDVRRMLVCAKSGFSTATDIADDLTSRGMPFRQAHEVVGKLVREAHGSQISKQALADLGVPVSILDVRESVRRRKSLGGPGDLGTQLRRVRRLHRKSGFADLA